MADAREVPLTGKLAGAAEAVVKRRVQVCLPSHLERANVASPCCVRISGHERVRSSGDGGSLEGRVCRAAGRLVTWRVAREVAATIILPWGSSCGAFWACIARGRLPRMLQWRVLQGACSCSSPQR
jgi:hypothetical protein